MARRERRKFSDEYKAEVVALVRSSGKNIGEISRDLDLTETAVREWVQRAEVDGGKRNGLTTAEREELSRLRRQVRVLGEERSILEKAAPTSKRHESRPPWRATLMLLCLVKQGMEDFASDVALEAANDFAL